MLSQFSFSNYKSFKKEAPIQSRPAPFLKNPRRAIPMSPSVPGNPSQYSNHIFYPEAKDTFLMFCRWLWFMDQMEGENLLFWRLWNIWAYCWYVHLSCLKYRITQNFLFANFVYKKRDKARITVLQFHTLYPSFRTIPRTDGSVHVA